MDLKPDGPWLAERARRSPDREALRFGGESRSYAELDRGARRIAGALGRLGVEPGDRVAVAVAPCIEALELLHAAIHCGAVLLPLNTRLTPAEIAFQLRDSDARWLVADARAAAAREAAGSLPSISRIELDALVGATDEVVPAAPFDLERELAILYTSGTTGRPKGARLRLGNFYWSAVGSAELLGVDPADRWLACMPLFHVGGLSIAIRSALAGTSVVLHPRFDPDLVNRELDDGGVTLVSLVATMLDRVLEARGDRRAPDRLRAVLLGGGPTPVDLVERAQRLGFRVAPTYGLTEACSQVATRLPDDARPPLDGRLRPLPGVSVRILDTAGRPAAPGEVGEIAVAGPTVMAGYWGRSDATEAALRDGWLHTGDLGRLDEEGALSVVDRRSDLIVSGGENVYPAEVEAVLGSHAGVREAAVFGEADAVYGARPVAVWVPFERGELASASDDEAARRLESWCRERLASYKVPVRFCRSESLPRSALGKILRRRLREDAEVRPPAV